MTTPDAPHAPEDHGTRTAAPTPAPTPAPPAGPAPAGGNPWTKSRSWYASQPSWVKWIARLILLVAAFALPSLGSVPLIGPQVVTAGTDWYTALFHMSYYVLLALGLNVVVGYAGLLDLGYVGFFAVGTYTVALLDLAGQSTRLQVVMAGGGAGRDRGSRWSAG